MCENDKSDWSGRDCFEKVQKATFPENREKTTFFNIILDLLLWVGGHKHQKPWLLSSIYDLFLINLCISLWHIMLFINVVMMLCHVCVVLFMLCLCYVMLCYLFMMMFVSLIMSWLVLLFMMVFVSLIYVTLVPYSP